MTSLKNKIVFVTGASSGIGKSTAKKFAEAGANILLCARRIERLNEFSKELKNNFGINVHAFQLDVRNQKSVFSAIENLPQEWKDISILVNNAGLSRGLSPFQEGDINDWEEMIDTNIKGLLYVTRTVLPLMVAKNEGHIINIGSVAGRWVYQKGNVYNATKFAVRALNEALKQDLHGTPIRVTTIDPGLVETEFSLVRFRGDAERAASVYKGCTPLTPDDIAESIVWSASRPPHVNILEMVIMATDQSTPTMVNRRTNS